MSKNKKYKKYNDNVNQSVSTDVESECMLDYYTENMCHVDIIRSAVFNYERFLRRVGKINDKKLSSFVKKSKNDALRFANIRLNLSIWK